MNNELNKFLSDLVVFYHKLQNYHWNIKGNDFFIVHEKLEEYYNEINEQIDEIAEHILILNGQPIGTIKEFLEISTIVEAKNESIASNVIFDEVLKDLIQLLNDVKQIKEMADKDNNYDTSALMDKYIENYGKKIWMLNQIKK